MDKADAVTNAIAGASNDWVAPGQASSKVAKKFEAMVDIANAKVDSLEMRIAKEYAQVGAEDYKLAKDLSNDVIKQTLSDLKDEATDLKNEATGYAQAVKTTPVASAKSLLDGVASSLVSSPCISCHQAAAIIKLDASPSNSDLDYDAAGSLAEHIILQTIPSHEDIAYGYVSKVTGTMPLLPHSDFPSAIDAWPVQLRT